MTVENARTWIIASSFAITLAQLLFLVIAPIFNFPLLEPQIFTLAQLIVPVFSGYLIIGGKYISHRIKQKNLDTHEPIKHKDLGLFIIGGLSVYVLLMVAVFIKFGYSNRVGAPPGTGMTFEHLSRYLMVGLSILSATTGYVIPDLFATKNIDKDTRA